MHQSWSTVELRNISKYFARVIANKNINMEIRQGEVLALLGENGAGKSTIMKILYGLYGADEGGIFIDGREVRIGSPKDAMAFGIGMIQQHFALVPAHTVTENIILGTVHGRIDYKAAADKVTAISERYGFPLNPSALIQDLDVGTQQKVEIVKALYTEARLLIMDEPTAVLTPQEADNLMAFMRQFAADGHSVVFITHKMKEVLDVADRIIVMRDGLIQGEMARAEADEATISRLMIGHELAVPKKAQFVADMAAEGLTAKNLTLRQHKMTLLDDISFDIRPGEILGIAGVSGNGQEELCEAICGVRTLDGGTLTLDGEDLLQKNLNERMRLGIGYVPVDRYRDAMIENMSVQENIYLKFSSDDAWNKGLFIDSRNLKEKTRESIRAYDVKTPGPDAKAGTLSGGNQQKLVLAREMRLATRLLILNQPTRGLDLGAINNIHETVLDARKNGLSILLVSTELSEIFALSDRIAIMYKGRFMGIYDPETLDQGRIGLLMAGIIPENTRKAGEDHA